MPTAAKLVGAVVFAVLGYLIGAAVLQTLPEGVLAPWLTTVCVIIMLIHGWLVAGRLAGQGWYLGAVNGFRTAIQGTIMGLIYFALYEMFRRAVTQRNYELDEAVTASFELFLEYGAQILILPIIIVIVGGGAICGLLVEAAGQRWR